MGRRLDGKIALITGASRGLGQYCAIGYGAEGATVVVAARTAEIDETARLIRDAGGEAFPVLCDVGDPASIQSMARAVLDKFGRLDVLLTNAIYYCAEPFLAITPEHWDTSFQVNVGGVFHTIRAFAPSMIERGSGNIITVSSIAAQRGSPYGATKRAVLGMTMGFAEELKPHGVAVNALRPVAAIDTPGWRASRPAAVLQTRSHRVSPPDSYVEAAILLAMQTASTTTGQEYTDAQVLKRFGAAESFERFRAMNAPVWSEG
jgi:NAD(P)-dependent dehydrogenase (short-subunit alcohol dehydrogenase family)